MRDTLDQTARHAAAVVAGDVEGRGAPAGADRRDDRLGQALAGRARAARSSSSSGRRAPRVATLQADGDGKVQDRGALRARAPRRGWARSSTRRPTADGARADAGGGDRRSAAACWRWPFRSASCRGGSTRCATGSRSPSCSSTAGGQPIARCRPRRRRSTPRSSPTPRPAGTATRAASPAATRARRLRAGRRARLVGGRRGGRRPRPSPRARTLRRRRSSAPAPRALLALVLALAFARRLTARARAADRGRARRRRRQARRPRRPSAATTKWRTLARTFNQMGDELASQPRRDRTLEPRARGARRRAHARAQGGAGAAGAGAEAGGARPARRRRGARDQQPARRRHRPRAAAARRRARPSTSDYEALKHIEEGARRASQVVQNLLALQRAAQGAGAHRRRSRTSWCATRCRSPSRSSATRRSSSVSTSPPAKPRARADAGQLAQVLLNLVANARTAMPSGGTLRIATRAPTGERAGGARRRTTAARASRPRSASASSSRSSPPRTTGPTSASGSSVSYRIVEEHGGRIDVQSEPGRGATFTVYLPSA